ncbi:MAG: isoprenyl transferase [Actinomycetales bacterium]
MRPTNPLYPLYTRRLVAGLDPQTVPHHVGIMLDGNRRWAKLAGETSTHGHRAGADKIFEFLGWCEETGVEVVTLWMLSTDNLRRPHAELEPLLAIIDDAVDRLAGAERWRVNPVGALDLLPDWLAANLREAGETTRDIDGVHVNVAVGYGGRQEIADAVRALILEQAEQGTSMEQLAEVITVDHIAEHLYTKGQPDPDLVIRTSGEQRLSGFLMWQSAHSEYYFCEAYWPDFRRVDFLRALRDYAGRQRRFGE